MNSISALGTILLPFIMVIMPGWCLVSASKRGLLPYLARVVLYSVAINTLILMVGVVVGVSVSLSFIAIITASLVCALHYNKRIFSIEHIRVSLLCCIIVFGITALFCIPFFRIQEGLPTGDVQKTIIWANKIAETNHFPDYSVSFSMLNRDPVDFYTPGLHALSALIMKLSPAPLVSIGLFSIVLSVCVSLVVMAWAREIFPSIQHRSIPFITGLLMMTEFRFLRYIREPGYHYQNIIGELFLFGMLMAFFSFIKRKKAQDAILFLVCSVAVFFTHQFSVFIAGFAMISGIICLIALHANSISRHIKTHRTVALAICMTGIVGVVILISAGLINKIPNIFTLHPHLVDDLPTLIDYPNLLGTVWFIAGVVGTILVLLAKTHTRNQRSIQLAFVAITCAILALSQGPALGIDIPPIRALYFSIAPLSIMGAYFFVTIGSRRKLLFIIMSIIVIGATGSSLQRAYASISHTIRTNSTLLPDQQYVISKLEEEKLDNAILIDDYNRRADSWFVLSGHPMFTRIASDIRKQMLESPQSRIRGDLYTNQLDFEKIYALGSMPIITFLMNQHEIRWVTGIAGSSYSAFSHNSALTEYAIANNSTVFMKKNNLPHVVCDMECEFLLRSSTLANDVGDNEDVGEHLGAQLRTPILSEPMLHKGTTYRQTNSQFIPISFNVGDFVQTEWDPQKNGTPIHDLKFVVKTTQPTQELSLSTPDNTVISLPATSLHSLVLPASHVNIDSRGYITLTILNPSKQLLEIDYIALGL